MILASFKLKAVRVGAVRAMVVGMLLASGAALADDRSQTIDRIMSTGPIPCTTESYGLLRAQLLDMFADAMMEATQTSLKLNEKWKPSNPDYERVMTLFKGALAESEVRSGPVYTHATGDQVIRSSFEAMNAADLQYAANFFAGRVGRLYWSFLVESKTCMAILSTLDQLPKAPARPPSLLARPVAYEAQFKKEGMKTSPAETKVFKESLMRLDPLMAPAYAGFAHRKDGIHTARSTAIITKLADQIRAIVKPYEPAS